jgi:putative ABC transport system substrate-binding protein
MQGGMSLAGCGLVVAPGQRPASVHRIAFLESGGNLGVSSPNEQAFEPFREGLRDLGYIEGQNVLIEYRDAELNPERLPALAAELVSLPVEIIVASNAPTALAASRATSTIPIVAAGGNVIGAGLVANIARPEGNITGVTTNSVEAIGKWIELLKETVPTITHLAVMVDLSNPASQPFLQAVQKAALSLQLQFEPYGVHDLDELSAAVSTAKLDGADGIVMVSGGVFRGSNDPRIGGATLTSKLPSVAETRSFAVNGGLLAHGPNTPALARRAVTFVDKILRGAKPGELPTVFNVVVNVKTALALGLSIPQSVLLRATEIIE